MHGYTCKCGAVLRRVLRYVGVGVLCGCGVMCVCAHVDVWMCVSIDTFIYSYVNM